MKFFKFIPVDVKNDEIEIKKKGDKNPMQEQLSTDAGKKQFDTGNSQKSEKPSNMDNDEARSELESDNQPPESESPKTHIIAPPGKTPKRQKILRNLDLPLDSEGFTPRRIKSTAHFRKIVEVERQKLTRFNNEWNSVLSGENMAEEGLYELFVKTNVLLRVNDDYALRSKSSSKVS